MDPASPEESRPGEAMADVPQKPSRGHCCDGLFHRPNAHFWCSVLILDSRRTRQQVGLQKIHSAREGQIQSLPRLGGLHHRYAVAT